MIPFPRIDPVMIRIGPLQVRWYGLMYVLGFLAAYFLIKIQKKARRLGLQGDLLQNLVFYMAVGLVVGARLGYVFFYQYAELGFYFRHPIEFIAVWHGGMSFHGGLAGAMLGGILFCRRKGLPVWEVADIVIVTAPVGVGLGRLGNFINGELFGRPASVPWAMVFPEGGNVARHPSQLYEAGLEGLALFLLLWTVKDRPFRPGALICLFLAGYGVFRFFVEFFRQPDPQIGLLWGAFSMGQLLCMGMILTAGILWPLLPKKNIED
ncbi:MAG: prolipoprotein diacylglyceryl transferase [Deltaproteobacteria bacterium]|nr:prolipoprotein diacylglyceryl transferase [Deltaproteobacteria bacterium]